MTVDFSVNFWIMMSFAMNFGLAIYMAFSNSRKAKEDEFQAIAVRVATLEVKQENGINKNDIIALHRRLDELMSSFKHMEGRIEGRIEGGKL